MYAEGHRLIDHICAQLFTAEKRRLASVIANLIDRNQEALGTRIDGFSHAGEHYRREGLRGNLTKPPLHMSLWKEMEKFQVDRNTVKDDEQLIRQVLYKLLDPCTSNQQVRDALPNCLTDTLPEWGRTLPRLDDEAFTIRGNARAERDYNKALPKLELYSAARLLY